MSNITYTLAIDTNDDGLYTPDEAITRDVVMLEWRLGMDVAFERVSRDSSAQITLRNDDGRYSPERTPLLTGTRVRISATDEDDTEHILFTGAIQCVEPLAGDFGQRSAKITLNGLESELRANLVYLPPMSNVTADVVIDAVLDACALRLYPTENVLLIDITGRNLINTHHPFGRSLTDRSLDEGRSVFAYVGHWTAGVHALDAIRDAVDSERGRFFVNREGAACFLHRHRTMTEATVEATFSDSMDDLRYEYGDSIINRVQVTITPREVGTAEEILWQLTQPQTIPANTSRRLIAAYRDADNRPQAALSLQQPPTYSATANPDGSGDAVDLLVGVAAWGASAAEILVENGTAQSATLQSLQLYGVPMREENPVTLDLQDKVSIALYGLGLLRLDLPALDSVEEAANIAQYELSRRKSPAGQVREITLNAWAHAEHVLSRTLFDRVRIADSQTGHAAEYLIVAEHHRVDRGGTRHRVVWTLEPAESDIYFVVNLASINSTRVIVPY